MESEEIYTKKKVKMQAAAFKDKKQRAPANKEGADNPDYENITLTFGNQDQLKGRHSPSKDQGSGPQEVGRPSVSTLSPFSLVPLPSPHPCSQDCRTGGASRLLLPPPPLPRTDSEMSRELLVLKTELWNVSTLVRECQKEQNQGWSSVRQLVTEAKQDINVVKRDVQTEGDKVKTLSGGALADLHWAEFVSRWVLGNWGRGQQGSHSPRAQGFKGTMDVTP
uniref:Mast cell-expressed membrane protein 1 n=1 Tax=Neovison vison TaxID=452646 RepID=A0A8C7ETW8_NEOVI